jgi:hypothetical protein
LPKRPSAFEFEVIGHNMEILILKLDSDFAAVARLAASLEDKSDAESHGTVAGACG